MFPYQFLRIAFIKEPSYKRNGATAFVLRGDRSISDGKETDEDAWKTPVLSLKAQDSIIPVEYPNGKEGLVVRGGGTNGVGISKALLKA